MADLVNQGKNVATKENFSDLDLLMDKHPVTGDVVTKKDTDAIKRSVRNIVMTNHYERPFKPNFGTDLRSRLFDINDIQSKRLIMKDIKEAILKLEPRVRDIKFKLADTMDTNTLSLTVFYNIKNSARAQQLELRVKRTR
jgi:phage baseplate assembly protein W